MDEQDDLLSRFAQELSKPTGDGKAKRSRGEKPPWYEDDSHEAAVFSHLAKWKRGAVVDSDSGAHPLVHAAWRCLAIACRETKNVPVVTAVDSAVWSGSTRSFMLEPPTAPSPAGVGCCMAWPPCEGCCVLTEAELHRVNL